jgi:hypothetical protein
VCAGRLTVADEQRKIAEGKAATKSADGDKGKSPKNKEALKIKPSKSPHLDVPDGQAAAPHPSKDGVPSSPEEPKTVGSMKAHASQTLPNQLATPPMRPISTSGTGMPPGVDDGVAEMLVAKLETFYETVNPDQVELAERLAKKFNYNAALLNRALREKYGIDLTTSEKERCSYAQGRGAKDGGDAVSAVELDPSPSPAGTQTAGSDQVLTVNEDFHYFQGFEDIKKTDAGISDYLITPPISSLNSRVDPSPLLAPANMPSIQEKMPEMAPKAMAGRLDLDANPYTRCSTIPSKLRCLCGQVEISFRAPPRFTFMCHCRVCRHCRQAPCSALAAYDDPTHLNCTAGLESVRYCRPEGGEGQPTLFFCSVCSMNCWTLDKVYHPIPSLCDSLRTSRSVVSFHGTIGCLHHHLTPMRLCLLCFTNCTDCSLD